MSREYDTLADVYDFLVPEALLEPEGSAAAFAPVLADLPPGARVLDCACGTGTLAVGLALRGFDVSASDASAEMVARTRALAGSTARIEVRRPWEDLDGGPYDAVFCVGNSITHARDRRAALAAMRGVLRDGGDASAEAGRRRPRAPGSARRRRGRRSWSAAAGGRA